MTAFLQAILSTLDTISQWVTAYIQAVTTVLDQYLDFVETWLCKLVKPLAIQIANALPDMSQAASNFTAFATIGSWANQWFPIDWVIGAIALFLAFFVTYFVVKLIVRLF